MEYPLYYNDQEYTVVVGRRGEELSVVGDTAFGIAVKVGGRPMVLLDSGVLAILKEFFLLMEGSVVMVTIVGDYHDHPQVLVDSLIIDWDGSIHRRFAPLVEQVRCVPAA